MIQLDPKPADDDTSRRQPAEDTSARGAGEVLSQATAAAAAQPDLDPVCNRSSLDGTESAEVELQCSRLPSRGVEYHSIVLLYDAVHCSACEC
jgi:hypothetical protein